MSVHDAVVRSFDDACRALIERDGVEAYKRLHGALLHLSHSIVTCDEVARGETQVCPCVAAIGLFVLENTGVQGPGSETVRVNGSPGSRSRSDDE